MAGSTWHNRRGWRSWVGSSFKKRQFKITYDIRYCSYLVGVCREDRIRLFLEVHSNRTKAADRKTLMLLGTCFLFSPRWWSNSGREWDLRPWKYPELNHMRTWTIWVQGRLCFEQWVGPRYLQTFFNTQILFLWFTTTGASCLGSLHKVHPTILKKVPKIAVFNGPDMSVSLSDGNRQTLDKFLRSLDV